MLRAWNIISPVPKEVFQLLGKLTFDTIIKLLMYQVSVHGKKELFLWNFWCSWNNSASRVLIVRETV